MEDFHVTEAIRLIKVFVLSKIYITVHLKENMDEENGKCILFLLKMKLTVKANI